jgi:predicted small lipoprotein YifL
MRRVVALVLAIITLSGCGNKGALYVPSPAKDSQQNSKPTAPRQ